MTMLNDPSSPEYERAATWMAQRSGVTLDKYKPMMRGLRLFDANLEHFKDGDTLQTIYHSSRVAGALAVDNNVYKQSVPCKKYFDPSLVEEVAREPLALRTP